MSVAKVATVVVALGVLSACADQSGNDPFGTKTIVGAATGAAGGGLVAAAAIGGAPAILGGVLLGGLLGGAIGHFLDDQDKRIADDTTKKSLDKSKPGQTSSWHNPDNGHVGTVTPSKTYQTASGEVCRDYEQTIVVDGKTQKARGTACKDTSGNWRTVSQ
ncbi:MAG: RT0821/Lpp0805 family surface protein [Alphaproteobacteria bacterium]